MKHIFYSLILLLFTQGAFAQLYTPIDTANLPIRTQGGKDYMTFSKLFIKGIRNEYKGGEFFYIKKKFENMDKVVNEDILRGQFVFDSRFDKMINEIVAEIVAKNQLLPTDFKFYVSRNIPLNASSLGNKCFVINMGTFYYLGNEDQLASVISHEIGHFVLKHSILDKLNDYALNKSSNLRDEVYSIKNDRNNKGDKAYNKLKEILYQNGKLSKKQEFDADSIGYVLYRNTKYHKSDYLTSLRLIEIYDTIRPLGVKTETYRNLFNLTNQPFNEAWLKKEDFSGYDYSKYKDRFNEDSISSHPDIDKRIAAMRKIFPEIEKEEIHEASAQFHDLQQLAQNELTYCLQFNEEYGFGVYLCLLRLQENPKDEFYLSRLGSFLEKIYTARKEYTLNRYLERVDSKNQSESYQQFLSFMWNLNLKELKIMADYYTKKGS